MQHALIIALLSLVTGVSVYAQEHPFIAYYQLTKLSGGINIEWTIQGGSTCNGIGLERSKDGVNFAQVHVIPGICGDPNNAVPYQWFDTAPPELSTVYYRIQLGFDGYSSIKSVQYDQLESSDQRFFPSPMHDEATLLLRVGSGATVELTIWSSNGQLVHQQSGSTGGNISLSLPGLQSGVYSYRAVSEGKEFRGRFVKS